MSRVILTFIFTVFAILMLGMIPVRDAVANARGWTPTVMLFPPGGLDNSTSFVADSTGRAYLMWNHIPRDSTDVTSYYYSVWQDGNWSAPVDLFVSTGAAPLGYPELVTSDDGWLYVFWNSGGAVFVSRAWSSVTANPHSWSKPIAIVYCDQPCNVPMDAALDAQGHFHMVITQRTGDVLYSHSATWSSEWAPPIQISRVSDGESTFMPRLAVEKSGRIHAVWSEVQLPQGYPSLRVMYAHSEADPTTWTQPRQIAGLYNADGNVIVTGMNTIHLAWNVGIGGIPGGRYYQRSEDAGQSWTMPTRFSLTSAMEGYPSLVQDSTGTLHILTGGAEYTEATRDHDSLAVLVPDKESLVAPSERARMAIVNGNTLLAIWLPGQSGIYVSSKLLDVPGYPTRVPVVPTLSAMPTAHRTGQGTPATDVVTATPNPQMNQLPPPTSYNASLPILTAVVPLLLIIGAFFTWRRFR